MTSSRFDWCEKSHHLASESVMKSILRHGRERFGVGDHGSVSCLLENDM